MSETPAKDVYMKATFSIHVVKTCIEKSRSRGTSAGLASALHFLDDRRQDLRVGLREDAVAQVEDMGVVPASRRRWPGPSGRRPRGPARRAVGSRLPCRALTRPKRCRGILDRHLPGDREALAGQRGQALGQVGRPGEVDPGGALHLLEGHGGGRQGQGPVVVQVQLAGPGVEELHGLGPRLPPAG